MGLATKLVLGGLAGAALFVSTAPATALSASAACPTGTQGVVIENNGSRTYVCTTAVRDAQKIIRDFIAFEIACEICPPK